jgi:pimeloyl-ACP methyl ester carboxylesterase
MATIDRDGAVLHYQVDDLTPPWTEAPAIVFCHGIGTDARMWVNWLPVLADRFRLVRFDLRGFGRSGTFPGAAGWTLDGLADDVLAVADAAGVDRFHLVGESTGGTVALHLAARGETRLTGITSSNAAHRGGSITKVRQWEDFIDAHGVGAWSDQMMEDRFRANELDDAARAWYAGVQSTSARDSLIGIADMLIAANLEDRLGDIRVPTLLLAPEDSPFVATSLMEEIAAAAPDADLRVFPQARHGLPFSHGRECATVLREFLAARGLD